MPMQFKLIKYLILGGYTKIKTARFFLSYNKVTLCFIEQSHELCNSSYNLQQLHKII